MTTLQPSKADTCRKACKEAGDRMYNDTAFLLKADIHTSLATALNITRSVSALGIACIISTKKGQMVSIILQPHHISLPIENTRQFAFTYEIEIVRQALEATQVPFQELPIEH